MLGINDIKYSNILFHHYIFFKDLYNFYIY